MAVQHLKAPVLHYVKTKGEAIIVGHQAQVIVFVSRELKGSWNFLVEKLILNIIHTENQLCIKNKYSVVTKMFHEPIKATVHIKRVLVN